MDDYETERDVEGGSEYYYSRDREAFYHWQPGRTLIELTDLRTGIRYTGYIQQCEKADGVCRDFMEHGRDKTDLTNKAHYWWSVARWFAA